MLTARPLSDVVLAINGGMSSEVLTSPPYLAFAPGNWDTAQTVTLQGVDDSPATVDGDQVMTLNIGVADAYSDNLWDPLPDQFVSVTNLDNDTAGFALNKAVATVSENGTTDTFTIVLTAKPLSNVVFDISSGNTSEVAVSPAQRTFTPSNWNVAQTVTVTGVNDSPATLDGSQVAVVTVAVNDGASDNAWDPLNDQTVTVTNQDNDLPGLSLSKTTATVSESGTTDTFTVALAVKPLSNVVLDVTSGNLGEAAVSPAQLTFSPSNWNVPQQVTITGVNDSPPTVDGNQTVTVTLAVNAAASDDAWDAMAIRAVSVTNQDNDAAGFALGKTALTVSESGAADTFSVVLTARPLANVVLEVTSGNLGEVSVSPAQLTFTTANWDTPQFVTVAGVNDNPATVDGSQAVTVTVSVNDAASDDAWDPLANQTVSVTNLDDDSAGFALSKAAVTVSESGTSETFTVVLTARPLSTVVFDVSSANINEATATPAQLSFSPAAWNTPQTVTVTGVDDFRLDGNQTTTVTVSVNDALSNDAWDPLAGQTVSVTNLDNDAAGFALSKTSVVVDESGGMDTLTVVLTAQPDSAVVLLLSSGNPAEATVGPASLTFTPGNWNAAQTVTVTGVDDPRIDGPQTTAITVRVDAAASDDNFDLLPEQAVSAANADNDLAGFTLSKLTATVSESGTTDTVTVVLTAQPDSDVVLTLTSGDTEEVTVAPASLTFTLANWNVPQTVTVTGIDDPRIDGAQTTIVTVSVDAANSDDNFDLVPAKTVAVTTTDAGDAAGMALNKTTASVSESGTSDTFTAVLTAQPDSDVVLIVSSGDPQEAAVNPAQLTFTPADWNVPQTVTVTGVDDRRIDGSQTTTVTVSVDAANSDDHFDPVPAQTVSVTTEDHGDVAGFILTKTSAAVSESGTTDAFGVKLAAQPDTDVVLTVASGDISEATVSPMTLTFTPDNWNVNQTVTITGVDDPLIDANQVTQVTVSADAVNSDDNFDAVPGQTVTVTTADNDVAGFLLSKSAAAVSESGTTDTFTVRLSAQPDSNVVLSVSGADPGRSRPVPLQLTFTPANWNVPQTVTVLGIQDDRIDGSQQTAVTVSVVDLLSDDHFDLLADQMVTVTTTDDDTAGVTLSKTAASVSESGSVDTFTIVLAAQPETNVVLSVTSGDTGEVTVNPASLTFTPANWNTPQTVTLTGADDFLMDGNQTTLVTVSVVDAASDNAFDNAMDQVVFVTTVDNDAVGITLSRTTAGVSESGSTDSFTVALSVQPHSQVVLNVSSGDTTEVTVSPATLTFTPLTWNVPQMVTVQGVDDRLIDGSQSTAVTVSVVDAWSDDLFDAAADQSVIVTTLDDDGAGFTVSKSTATVSEAGSKDAFTVVLTAQPDTTVVLTVTSADVTEVTASPPTLIFSPGDWNSPQTVTVTGVDDKLLDGMQMTLVTLSVADALSDDHFDTLSDQIVTVMTTDDDVAGFRLSKVAASVSENGTSDTFTVVLTAQPDAGVTLEVTGGDTGEAMVSPAALTFTPASWNVPQMVTVTGADDFWIDGSQTTLVTVSVNDAVSDGKFGGVSDQTVTVTTADNDVAGLKLSRSAVTVSEAGSTDTFTVSLTAQPLSFVTLTVTSADPGEATVSPTLLTFTTADWSVPQTVTVTGVDDQLVDGNQLTVVALSVVDAVSGDEFDMMPDQSVYVTTTDDDEAGFTLSRIALTVSESGTTGTFTVVLAAQPVLNVRLTITSGDVGEATVSPPALTFTPADWNVPQTVTVTGVDDHAIDGSQLTQVTVSVDDAMSDNQFDALADQSVFVTTTDDDTAGFTLSKTSVTVSESGTTDTLTAVLTAQPAASVTLTVSSADEGEATVSVSFLTFTPGNWNSPQTVTITGVDDLDRDGDQTTSVTVGVDGPSSDDQFDGVGGQIVSVTTADNDVGWHNTRNPFDVDGNGRVEAADVLKIINYINAHLGDPSLPPPPAAPPPYYDVNNDGLCTAGDVLAVINYVNSHGIGSSAEGEEVWLVATPAADRLAATAARERLQAGDRPMSVRPIDLPQPASIRRALRADAVFAAWSDAPGDELADTLAQDLPRVTL